MPVVGRHQEQGTKPRFQVNHLARVFQTRAQVYAGSLNLLVIIFQLGAKTLNLYTYVSIGRATKNSPSFCSLVFPITRAAPRALALCNDVVNTLLPVKCLASSQVKM